MANLQHYRIKVNLEKFFSDQRKLSYVYVDTSKISSIHELEKKIEDLFYIMRPFYLMTQDNVFLPVDEDVRIVNQDDVIMVLPHRKCTTTYAVQPKAVVKAADAEYNAMDNNLDISKTKITSTPEVKVSSDTTSNDTDIEMNTDTKMNEKNGSDINNFTANIPQKKRRRVRRKRAKKNSSLDPTPSQTPTLNKHNGHNGHSTDASRQPVKILLNKTNANGGPKHLKFNWDDDKKERNGEILNGKTIQTPQNLRSSKPIVRSNEAADLSSLLSLRGTKVPKKFVSSTPQSNSTSNTQTLSTGKGASHVKMNIPNPLFIEELSSNSSLAANCNTTIEENMDYAKVNPLDYPVHNTAFQKDDIVAFRTLKIGDDYSPTVSGYIIAKMLTKDSVHDDYTFMILNGHDQIKIPDGKFSLPSDEDNESNKYEDKKLPENVIITMQALQLVEPRLIHRPNV